MRRRWRASSASGEQVVRTGMFGTQTTGDTSGYGGLPGPAAAAAVHRAPLWLLLRDEVADAREHPAGGRMVRTSARPSSGSWIDRGELTLYVRREYLVEVARAAAG